MKKTLISFLLLLLIAFVQTASTKDCNRQVQKSFEEWKTLSVSKYSIQYPPTWSIDQSGQVGSSFILFSPLESDKDKFRENVNLMIQDMTGRNISLDKYTQISEDQIKTLATNSKLKESTRIKTTSGEYQKIHYTADQGVFSLEFVQYYWVINEKAYVLTFTTEKSKYNDFKDTGEKILNSFSFKD